MPRKQQQPLKIHGTFDEALKALVAPARKSAKAAPKTKGKPKKGQK